MSSWSTIWSVPKEVRKGPALFHVIGIKPGGGTAGYGYHDNYTAAEAACKNAKHDGYTPVMFNISHPLQATIAPQPAQFTPQYLEGANVMNNHRFNVIYQPHPTLDDVQRGIKPNPVQIVPPTDVMAAHEAHARMIAARAIPKGYEDRLDLITINVKSGL